VIESRPVRLEDLLVGVGERKLVGRTDGDITSLCYRSDQAEPGSLFFCAPGAKHDGHDFAHDAVQRGAVALCVDRQLEEPVAQVVVPSVRRAMGPVAAEFFGHPSRQLVTVGITGTNGKTTSAFLVAHLLDKAGIRAGMLGTVEKRIGGVSSAAGRTTPEALDLQRVLAEMVAAGDKAAVMEVSSHALDQGRTLGMRFGALAFTNLTQDHLDYHESLDHYFAAKCLLFFDEAYQEGHPVAAINVDDPYGLQIARRLPRNRVVPLSSAVRPGPWGPADLEWSDYKVERGGTRGIMVVRGAALEMMAAGRAGHSGLADAGGCAEVRLDVSTPLLGEFNVANMLTALGTGLILGLDPRQMVDDVADFGGVPGRMEPVDAGQEFVVIVDYAHTPDSVRNALETARGFSKGRLISVVGCGGDRDKGKRPLMGREAEKASDLVIVTSDNPRSEDPLAIIGEITGGLTHPDRALVEPDRRRAIAQAIAGAREGDVVVILGKGHETGQEFASETVPFDDRLVAKQALLALREVAG